MARERTGFPELLTAARDGADWAWSQLHRDVSPRLRGYLVACEMDDVDGEIGEIFVSAARTINDFDGDPDDFAVYIFRIAVERVRARDKSVGTRGRKRARLPTDEVPDYVAAALSALDGPVRDTILLRRVAKLTVDQVANILDTSTEMVVFYQQQGLIALQDTVF